MEESSVREFIAKHGTYPEAKGRHRKTTFEQRLSSVENALAIGLDSGSGSTVTEKDLRSVIRAQSRALDSMNEAARLNESALELYRQGDGIRGEAALQLIAAQAAMLEVVRLQGIPDVFDSAQ